MAEQGHEQGEAERGGRGRRPRPRRASWARGLGGEEGEAAVGAGGDGIELKGASLKVATLEGKTDSERHVGGAGLLYFVLARRATTERRSLPSCLFTYSLSA